MHIPVSPSRCIESEIVLNPVISHGPYMVLIQPKLESLLNKIIREKI